MKKMLFFLFIPMLSAIAYGNSSGPDLKLGEEDIILDGQWKTFEAVSLENCNEIKELDLKAEAKFYAPDTDDSAWKNQDVPFFKKLGISWYRKKFNIVETDGKCIRIKFGALRHKADIFLNGKFLQTVKSGLACPAEVDITNAAKKGENLLAVRLCGLRAKRNKNVPRRQPELLDKKEGFMPAYLKDGISQSVKVEVSGTTYIDDVFVISHVADRNIEVRLFLRNISASDAEVSLNSQIVPCRGNSIPAGNRDIEKVKVAAGASLDYTFNIDMKNPELWSPENPYLYNLKIDMTEKGKLQDRNTTRFGFREFTAQGADFYLNGQKIFLRGGMTCQDTWFLEKRLTPEYAKKLFAWAKNANCNFIRFWNSFRPEFYFDMADEAGIMVSPEFGFDGKVCMGQGIDDETINGMKEQMKNMLKAYRNHPSIVFYALENENLMNFPFKKSEEENFKKVILAMHEFCREIDPTRPVSDGSGDSAISREREWFDKNTDIFDAHKYSGWYHATPSYFLQRELPSLMEQSDALKKPLGMTEFDGAYTLRPEEYMKTRDGYGHKFWPLWGGTYPYWQKKDDKALVKKQLEYQEWIVDYLVRGMRRQRVPLLSCTSLMSWFKNLTFDEPTGTYYILKEAYAPLMVSAEAYDRNLFAGQEISVKTYVVNDYQQEKKATLLWEVKDKNKVLTAGKTDCSVAAFGLSVIPVSWSVPSNVSGKMELLLTLKDGENILSKDSVTFNTFLRNNLKVSKDKKILLFDPAGETEKILVSNNVAFQKLEDINDIAKTNGDADLLIIGSHSALGEQESETIKTNLENVLGLGTGAGHNILVLEQGMSLHERLNVTFTDKTETPSSENYPVEFRYVQSRYEGSDNLTIVDPNSPVFDGLKNSDFVRWNGFCNIMGTLFIAPSESGHSLLSLAVHSSRGYGQIENANALVEYSGEFDGGVGSAKASRILFSQVEAVSRYDIDPAARKYINNLIRYCLE